MKKYKYFCSKESRLPALSFSDLNKTCQLFSMWSKPFLSSNEIETTQKAVKNFLQSPEKGPFLQKMLEQRLTEEESFLENLPYWEKWYLKARDPLPIYSNPYYVFNDSSTSYSLSLCDRAAKSVVSFLRFRENLLQNPEIEWDERNPLSLEQYKNFFSTTRIPGLNQDFLKSPWSSNGEVTTKESHIIVIFKGNFYKVDVLSDKGDIRDTNELSGVFLSILQSFFEGDVSTERISSPALLTTLPRTYWFYWRKRLLQVDSQNIHVMNILEKALFVVCLEDHPLSHTMNVCRNVWHGKGGDRWFDKSLQLIIGPGYRGLCFEHSGLDGAAVTRLVRWVTEDEKVIFPRGVMVGTLAKKVSFILDSSLCKAIEKAAAHFDSMIKGTSLIVRDFPSFGLEDIKKHSLSTDAFVQVAIQSSFFKSFSSLPHVFESVHLRHFRKGRTDGMRPVTKDSVLLVKGMREGYKKENLKELLQRVSQSHRERIAMYMNGYGPEAHLSLLYEVWKENSKDGKMPDIFQSPGWLHFTQNEITTSTTLPTGLKAAGYGPVEEKGFAVRYLRYPHSLRFSFSSRCSEEVRLKIFIENMFSSLEEMMTWQIF
jgi:carnitine O-acetyltransferase